MTPEQQKIIEWLDKEHWYPVVHPTTMEMEVADLLNKILEDIKDRFINEFTKK